MLVSYIPVDQPLLVCILYCIAKLDKERSDNLDRQHALCSRQEIAEGAIADMGHCQKEDLASASGYAQFNQWQDRWMGQACCCLAFTQKTLAEERLLGNAAFNDFDRYLAAKRIKLAGAVNLRHASCAHVFQ